MVTVKKQRTKKSSTLMWLGPLLLAVGIIGLVWATQSSSQNNQSKTATGSDLQVQDGSTGSANQSQTQAGGQLQGAAKVNDLIKGRDATDLQQGSAADALTKDATLK